MDYFRNSLVLSRRHPGTAASTSRKLTNRYWLDGIFERSALLAMFTLAVIVSLISPAGLQRQKPRQGLHSDRLALRGHPLLLLPVPLPFCGALHGLLPQLPGPVEKTLRDSGIDKKNTHESVLVCGSTRIPKEQAMIQAFLINKKRSKSINPDETSLWSC
ncbi:unnamed protein product [Polarella glacialis]|uniref:Uncharacterized protein n=1 Tax=Polarella glacialis TaxID=89957 RepID=A0A813D7H9_POLGL|nr:unnamed protein product [Polarella glacialis]